MEEGRQDLGMWAIEDEMEAGEKQQLRLGAVEGEGVSPQLDLKMGRPAAEVVEKQQLELEAVVVVERPQQPGWKRCGPSCAVWGQAGLQNAISPLPVCLAGQQIYLERQGSAGAAADYPERCPPGWQAHKPGWMEGGLQPCQRI